MSAPPPDPRRYITDNDADGQSFFSTEFLTDVPVVGELGGAKQRLLYTTNPAPDNLNERSDLQSYLGALRQGPALVKPGGGTNVWQLDFPPEFESPMHRTVSVDLIIVHEGALELTLSKEGEVRWIAAGEVVVQRSTMHKWRNPSKTEWVRLFAIMSECEPVTTEKGLTLGTDFPGPDDGA